MSKPDLSAYLDRIGMAAPPAATPDGLARLLVAHREAIAFENLDVMLGRGIAIASDHVFAKLVTARRGGYCFEHNRLLADVLGALGLPNRPLLARVRLGPPGATPPRTHVLLLVELGGEFWIADAGFGGSFLPPLPLREGAGAATGDGARHRLVRRDGSDPLGGEWLLERAGPAEATDGRGQAHGAWQAQYSFDLAAVAPDDLEQANHWTATRPGTRFTTLHVVSRVLPGGFAAMTDRQLTVFRAGEGAQTREICGPADYARTLRDVFGLALGDDEVAALPLF